ncbi:MAG: hypothetical protein KBA31_21935 [Alphaproteobacteria bacterium]|nr:hypothetical protein [Alphaproteobacteria bacterium]
MVALDRTRPLIICDADEVLLQFLAGLERFLDRQNCYVDLTSFRIHGNVKRKTTHEPVADEAVTRLIADFFATDTRHLDPVPGAAAALQHLSDRAQIVILSNLPETSRAARIENLTEHGMLYPVVAGKGPKGPVVRTMIEGFDAPVVFIDDLPPNISSVASEAPHVTRLHFIADPRLARLMPASPDAHGRIDDWPTAATWIHSVLDGT